MTNICSFIINVNNKMFTGYYIDTQLTSIIIKFLRIEIVVRLNLKITRRLLKIYVKMFKITCCGTVKVCLPSVSKQPKNKKIINTTTFYYKFFITINSFQAKSDLNLLILSLLSKLIFWVTTWCWWPFKLLWLKTIERHSS